MNQDQFQRLGDLGSGNFTSTYAVRRLNDNQIFAVKFINPEKLAAQYPQNQQEISKLFIQECQQFISLGLQHDNLVKYIQLYLDHDSQQEGILMEMMDMSLKRYLHEGITQQALPFHIQTNLCHDIIQGLKFLHQQEIVHQNLSSSSVLLTFSSSIAPSAKISDSAMTRVRQSLGLLEVSRPPDDILSYGVLMVEIISKQPLSLSNQMLRPALESIQKDHPLLATAISCLGEAENRPSADDIASYVYIVTQTATFLYKQGAPTMTHLHHSMASHSLKRSTDAVIDKKHGIVYLRQAGEKSVHQFDVNNDKWTKLPDCTNLQCSLAFIESDDSLLAIGGTPDDESPRTADVYKLKHHQLFKQWDLATRMPTARGRPTSLTCTSADQSMLIVAGGETLSDDGSGIESLKTVEILNINVTQEDSKWHRASPLPGTICCSSGAICNETICLLGGWSKRNCELLSVYTCHLQELIASCTAEIQVWKQIIPNCPVAQTTCITWQDKPLIVGGIVPDDPKKMPVDDIRIFNEYTHSWNVVGHLPAPRYLCFVLPLSDHRFLVIGGHKDTSTFCKDVNIFELK